MSYDREHFEPISESLEEGRLNQLEADMTRLQNMAIELKNRHTVIDGESNVTAYAGRAGGLDQLFEMAIKAAADYIEKSRREI